MNVSSILSTPQEMCCAPLVFFLWLLPALILGFPLPQSLAFLQVSGMSQLCLSDHVPCLCY